MDLDPVGWSTEDITLLIQSLAHTAIEQFVHDHPFLQQRALAGFSKRLPPNYPQRLASHLSQRAVIYQQTLQELIKLLRQEKQPLCEAIEQIEPPLTLAALGPLIDQYGGRAVLSTLHTNAHAETLGELLTTLKQGIKEGGIPLEPSAPPPARDSGKLTLAGASTAPAQPTTASSAPNRRERPSGPFSTVVTTLPRPSGGLAARAETPAAPKTIPEFFAALETQLQSLHAIQQTIEASGTQLSQHQITNDPQALPRILERLNAASQKLAEGLNRFAELDSALLNALRAETQQAEAAGQAENLSDSLPPAAPATSISEASARLQAFHQAHERLTAALTLNEQRLAALKAEPAAIEILLREIEELEGETEPLRARLTTLKNASTRQIERTLQSAEKLHEQAASLRSGLLQEWHNHLLRAYQDAESLLNQSLHLSADLPEITNLQHSLQQARILLETPLAPNAPIPLPFPPAQVMTCRQQLNQQSEQLRQALATFNPQIALAALQDFEQHDSADLTPQQLHKIGAALVGAASLRAGYAGLIWRVGTTLLAALDNAPAEQFYERFGFVAVATAIAASLRSGDFPLGLTFAEKDYLFYTEADIASVFRHERVLGILSYHCAADTFPALPADCFATASPAVRQAALHLLSRAAQINFPEPLRLQLSAALLAEAASPEERAQAARLLTRSLIDQQQHLNAYCVWRALALEQPNLYADPTGQEALFSLIWRFGLDTHTPSAQLAALCADSALQEASFYVPGIALALALGALALARARHPRGEEWASLFLDMLRDHHHYLAISDALRARLPKPSGENGEDEAPEMAQKQLAIQSIQAELNAALAEADRRLQVSNYRFAPTKQLRNQIDAQVRPLLTALQQGLEPTGDLGRNLSQADPLDLTRALIQEAERQRRQEGRDPIEGDDLKKLRKDLENLLKHLVEAASKHAELAALGGHLPTSGAQPGAEVNHSSGRQREDGLNGATPWDSYESMQPELRRLLSEAPHSRDLLQRALPGIALDLS